MDLSEAFELYAAAVTVAGPFEVAPDLEYVIDDEELDYEWRLVRLPLDATGCDLTLAPTPGCADAEEDERFGRIREWMRSCGGAEAALAACPPIGVMTDDKGLDHVDGRHRLALAREAGLTHVTMLVGAEPGWRPAAAPGMA